MMNTDYRQLNETLSELIKNVEYNISNLANASALLWQRMSDINWAGFYIMRNGHLELGPFQGKIACTTIEIGKGVCGTAVKQNKTIVADNVHMFPGHIACDSASNSEIVIPLHVDGEIFGVLDIDSPLFSRFSDEDKKGLESFAEILELTLKIL